MKKILLMVFALLVISISEGFSQVIKVENGLSLSWMKGDNLEQTLPAYSVMLGCDYLEHDWFYMSSEIGYIKKGGKDHIYGFAEELEGGISRVGYANLQSNLHYIQLNTSFRVKHSFNKLNVYLGIAPTLDFLVKEDSYTTTENNKYENDYHANRVVFGIMPELGAFYDAGKMRISLNVSYTRNLSFISKIGKLPCLVNNTLLMSVGIGYKI